MKKRGAFMLTALCFILAAHVAYAKPTFYSYGDREQSRIAITIDDWYEPELIGEFLDAAEEYGCKLTLYPIGVNIRESEGAAWQSVLDRGHELGNHSNTHKDMKDLSRDSIYQQFTYMESRLTKALGYAPVLNTCRLPFGSGKTHGSSGAFGRAIESAGYLHVVFWDIDDNTAAPILEKVKNGSIILLHANRHDLNTLQQILPTLSERGYEMVTVSELLYLTKDGMMTDAQIAALSSPSPSPDPNATPAPTLPAGDAAAEDKIKDLIEHITVEDDD